MKISIVGHKNATVNEMWVPSLGQGGWNLRFYRDFNDWELDLIRGLLNMLRDFRISSKEDSVLWKGGGHGKYGVKDAYNVLAVPNACAFPTKCIWVDKVPTKATFFAWEARGGRFSPWIGFKSGDGSSLTAVFCAVVKKKM